MNQQIFDLIDEQKTPLFRIMSLTNGTDPIRRSFENNISAFHIGNGFILSVAHNLRTDAQLFQSIDETVFQNDLLPNSTPIERTLLLKCCILDTQTNKRYLTIIDNRDVQSIIAFLKRINYDTRYVMFYSKGISKPYLIIQFNNNLFYNDAQATTFFDASNSLPEPALNTNTFLIELELIQAFYSEDIALYKIRNVDSSVIAKIPYTNLNFDVQQLGNKIYCLQSSPSSTNMGRLFNEARVDGLLDQHAIQNDMIGGNVFFKGLRYFLRCYFRFGSSGAPYFIFNQQSESFEVNAIQSEASPIQLLISNNMSGNAQYINAIASPLKLIEDKLKAIIS